MRRDHASHTAEGAAALRAAGRFERREELKNPDALALELLGPRLRRVIENPLLRRITLTYYAHRLPGMYEAHLARSHHFDRLVSSELTDGAEQLLILGAGLDSRAYRFRALLGDGAAFEVDHPATSRFKLAQLEKARLDATHVRFVDVDFSRQSTEERLLEAGFDLTKRTVITWEGVIMYLNDEAVSQVLRFVATLGKGSSIVFDYVFPDFFEAPERYRHARRHLSYVRTVDEPYTFGLAFESLAGYLEAHGLALESNVDAPELERRYLAGMRGRITPWYAIAQGRARRERRASC